MTEGEKNLLPTESKDTAIQPFRLESSPQTAFIDPTIYMQSRAVAKDLMQQQALPKGYETPGQAMLAIEVGRSMGMTWPEALASFYYVNGALNIWGKAIPKRLRVHGYKFEFLEEDDTHCKARVWKEEAGKVVEEYTEDFKFEDAKKSGYTEGKFGPKVGWKPGINRIKKMRYNVLSMIISTYIPEVLDMVGGIVEVSQDYAETESKELKKKDIVANLPKVEKVPEKPAEAEIQAELDEIQEDTTSMEEKVEAVDEQIERMKEADKKASEALQAKQEESKTIVADEPIGNDDESGLNNLLGMRG